MPKMLLALMTAIVVSMTATETHAQSGQDHHWTWGWGTYDATPDERNIAIFDWSFIHVGNQVDNLGRIGDGRQMVQRVNRILALNPKHKFVVLFWPMYPLRNTAPQFSLFDYLYNAEAKNTLNRRIRQQAEIARGISNPKAVVAMTFLEELPGHVTSEPYANTFNRPLNDIQANAAAITAELGRPFDKARDRLWWGRRYCDALREIHTEMKKHLPDAKVFYWPAERYFTLDHVGDRLRKDQVLPFHLKDLLRDGVCEGLFGFINTPSKFEFQTLATAEKYDIPYFTQLSLPGNMTIANFPTCMQVARRQHRLNLGTFLFKQDEVGEKRVQKKSVQRYLPLNESEVLRLFCYENQVNTRIVENNIVPPRVHFLCDLSGAKAGDNVVLKTVVHNPRDGSWFGMDDEKAMLKNLALSLVELPRGMEFTGPKRQAVPALAGQSFAVQEWTARLNGDWNGYKPHTLKAELRHRRLEPIAVTLAAATTAIQGTRKHIRHNTGTWLFLPTSNTGKQHLQLVLHAFSGVQKPRVTIGDKTVSFNGKLDQRETLTIGPGNRARLLPGNMLHRKDATCGRGPGVRETASKSFVAWGSQKYAVEMGRKYEIAITGRVADGASDLLKVEYLGRDGNWNNLYSSATVLTGKFTKTTSTQRVTIQVPKVDGKSVFVRILLYNQANKGSVFLRTVVLKKAGGERDVSDQLSGKLPTPGSHPILVKYADSTRAFAAYWRLRVDLKLVDTQERPDTVSCEARVRHRARVSHSKP